MQKRCDLLVLKVDAVAVVLLKVDPAVSEVSEDGEARPLRVTVSQGDDDEPLVEGRRELRWLSATFDGHAVQTQSDIGLSEQGNGLAWLRGVVGAAPGSGGAGPRCSRAARR